MCKKCRNIRLPAVLSRASQCGHQVNKGSLKWCGKCALAKGLCMHCGGQLQPQRSQRKNSKKK